MPLPKYKGYKPVLHSILSRFPDALTNELISIKCSSEWVKNSCSNLFDWDSENGWSSLNQENQFFVLDFKENFVSIPFYGFRPFSQDHALKEWKISGSNDNKNWVPIDYQAENICEGNMDIRDSVNYPGVLFCMKYIEKFYQASTPGYFHMIKVQQIGKNTGEGQYNVDPSVSRFYLGAFEIYGEIRGKLQESLTLLCKTPKIYFNYLIITLFFIKH